MLAGRTADGGQVKQRIPAIGFVNENKLESGGTVDPARVKLLERWLDAGLELGEPTAPRWVQDLAGIRESPRGSPD